jgi:hypothetical protein
MRKLVIGLVASVAMITSAHADWNGYRHHPHHYHGGGCYNCNINRGGGDAGLALFGGLVGGMILGGALSGANQNYYAGPGYGNVPVYEPVCQRVFAGSVWNGWRWVNTYQTICD